MFVNALLRAYFFFLLFFFLSVLLFSSTRPFWFFMKRSTQRVPRESSNGSRWSLKLSQWVTTSYLKKTTFSVPAWWIDSYIQMVSPGLLLHSFRSVPFAEATGRKRVYVIGTYRERKRAKISVDWREMIELPVDTRRTVSMNDCRYHCRRYHCRRGSHRSCVRSLVIASRNVPS